MSSKTLTVQAAPGTRCPMEGEPRKYITDTEAVTVPDTSYYRRLLRDTSLVEPAAEKPARKKAAAQEVL
jgi:hypothetical protein